MRTERRLWMIGAIAFILALASSVAISTNGLGSWLGPSEAATAAASILGLSADVASRATVTSVVPADDNTPYLAKLINGRTCYIVTFDGVEMTVESTDSPDVRVVLPIHTLNALIDAESGQVLKVWSKEWLSPPCADRTVPEAESRIRVIDGDTYDGIPTTAPKQNLTSLLKHFVWAFGAEQIDASYVMYHGAPTWIVLIHSRQPILPFVHSEAGSGIYAVRVGFDADTGKEVLCTNIH